LIDYYHDLYAANELKELLTDVFNTCSKDEAERLWNEWYELAMALKLRK
ncbi:MAG: transposase, partial [Aeromonadales bacterium]|nr:transposase [Aeromonadales bacterium]